MVNVSRESVYANLVGEGSPVISNCAQKTALETVNVAMANASANWVLKEKTVVKLTVPITVPIKENV